MNFRVKSILKNKKKCIVFFPIFFPNHQKWWTRKNFRKFINNELKKQFPSLFRRWWMHLIVTEYQVGELSFISSRKTRNIYLHFPWKKRIQNLKLWFVEGISILMSIFSKTIWYYLNLLQPIRTEVGTLIWNVSSWYPM